MRASVMRGRKLVTLCLVGSLQFLPDNIILRNPKKKEKSLFFFIFTADFKNGVSRRLRRLSPRKNGKHLSTTTPRYRRFLLLLRVHTYVRFISTLYVFRVEWHTNKFVHSSIRDTVKKIFFLFGNFRWIIRNLLNTPTTTPNRRNTVNDNIHFYV